MNLKNPIVTIVSIFLILVTILFTGFYFLRRSGNHELKVKGDDLVKKIETFERDHHKLPDSLEQIGYYGDGPLYYQKDSLNSPVGKNYIIWFGTELGESVTYHSALKKWDY